MSSYHPLVWTKYQKGQSTKTTNMNFTEALHFIRTLRDSHLTVSEIQSRIEGIEFSIDYDEALLIDETLFGRSGGLWAHAYGNPLLGSVIVLSNGDSA